MAELGVVDPVRHRGAMIAREGATTFVPYGFGAGDCLQTPNDTGCQPARRQLFYSFTVMDATTDTPRLLGLLQSEQAEDWIIFLPKAEPAVPTATDVAVDLRERLDLPIDDVAAMCGVRRRQFYNILNGETRRPQQEQHMLLLRELIAELDAAVGADPTRLRTAVLMPITEDYESFYDVAVSGNEQFLRRVGRALLDRLERGDVTGMVPRPAPSLRKLQSSETDELVDEALRAMTSVPDGDER